MHQTRSQTPTLDYSDALMHHTRQSLDLQPIDTLDYYDASIATITKADFAVLSDHLADFLVLYAWRHQL